MLLYKGFLEKYIIEIKNKNKKQLGEGGQFSSFCVMAHLNWPFCFLNAILAWLGFVASIFIYANLFHQILCSIMQNGQTE